MRHLISLSPSLPTSLSLSLSHITLLHALQMFSSDNGATWSAQQNITQYLGKAGPYDVGPGVGLQLTRGPHAGRLLFIGHHNAYEYDAVWYSDDGGVTYELSSTSFPHMDEVCFLSL